MKYYAGFKYPFSLHQTHTHHNDKGLSPYPSNSWQVNFVSDKAWKETLPGQGYHPKPGAGRLIVFPCVPI